MSKDLIAKLEASDGPSRELDAEIISLFINPVANDLERDNADYTFVIDGQVWRVPEYTSSLDAALMLVPEGHWWTAGDCRREKHARVAPEAVDDDGHEAFGATVAIALCIAALRARGEG